MVGWAAIEMLKVTPSYLLSPAYFCSDLFWTALGYGPASTQRIVTCSRRNQSITGSRGNPPGPGEAIRRVEVVAVEETEASTEGMKAEVEEDLELQLPSQTVLADDPEPTTQHTPSASSTSTSTSSSTTLPSTPLSTQTFDSEATAYQATISSPSSLTSRPLSSLLAIFSYRATVCLSSFELLPDDALGGLSEHAREPTEREKEVVRRRMKSEVEVVERAIEKAIEERGVDETVKVREGKTYFEEMERSFVDVGVSEEGVDTVQFLLALASLFKFFELFAPGAATLCSSDILEDIRRIRVRYTAFPVECRTLELLVVNESTQRRKLATESLMWMFRGLKFVALSIKLNLESPMEELSESFSRAWDREYSSYFSWVVRPLFKLLIRACPPRKQFYERLGSPLERVEMDLKSNLDAIELQVNMLEKFYKEGKHYK